MVKKEGTNSQLFVGKVPKDRMGIERAVILPHAGVIPANDEMSTPIVFPDEGVKNGLPGAGIAHRRRENRQHHAIFWIVPGQKDLVAA